MSTFAHETIVKGLCQHLKLSTASRPEYVQQHAAVSMLQDQPEATCYTESMSQHYDQPSLWGQAWQCVVQRMQHQ